MRKKFIEIIDLLIYRFENDNALYICDEVESLFIEKQINEFDYKEFMKFLKRNKPSKAKYFSIFKNKYYEKHSEIECGWWGYMFNSKNVNKKICEKLKYLHLLKSHAETCSYL